MSSSAFLKMVFGASMIPISFGSPIHRPTTMVPEFSDLRKRAQGFLLRRTGYGD
jgi:hypothetical protein